MPGIAGLISHDLKSSPIDQCRTMVSHMCYDSRWKFGQSDTAQLGLSAGWVAEPGSFADCMPAWNEQRTVGLILCGEEFGVADELSGLRARGHVDVKTDASSLVHWYEELGLSFFAKLNGRFSGVLVDLRAHTVTLFNDRFGLERLYFHESKAGLYFASEAKAIIAVLPELRQIDQKGLAEFFSVGCVLQNRSLFTGVSLLPAGSMWTFHRDGRIEKRSYFDRSSWEQQDPLEPAAYGERLIEIFSRIAPRYFRSNLPTALSLTGGLDSRMILAWLRAAPGSLPCYTFGGPYRDCADVRIARQLARLVQQPHTTIRIAPDFFDEFSTLAGKTVYATDGTMDVSGAVELYVNQRARQIAPIRVTGNYGSEILRSNVAFRPRPLDQSLFTPEFCRLIDEAAVTYQDEAVGHRLSFIAFKQVPWHHYARYAAERSQITPRSPFLDNELVALAYRAPAAIEGSAEPILQLIAKGNPVLDTVGSDRALRAHSVSILSNLQHRWQEFTAKAEYAYDYGMPNELARVDHALKALHLENLFLGRHKFYHYRVWYRDQLGSALQDGGFTRPLPCYANGAPQRLITEHTSGKLNRTLELHKLLTVQLVDRLFGAGPCRN